MCVGPGRDLAGHSGALALVLGPVFALSTAVCDGEWGDAHPGGARTTTLARQEGDARRWRSQLENTAKLAASIPHQVIVAGDLNATPWCEGMRLLKNGSGLDFRSQPAVWKPTWGLRGPMMMPIDHVLMKSGLMVTKRTISEQLGSDHRSVLVEMQPEVPH